MKSNLTKINLLILAVMLSGIIGFSLYTTINSRQNQQAATQAEIGELPNNEDAITKNSEEKMITPPDSSTTGKEAPLQDSIVTDTIEPSRIRPALLLTGSTNQQILKLGVYQQKVGGFVADRLMVFTNMPQTTASIRASAQYITRTSKEFKKYGIKPIFVFEPSDENGSLLNLKKISQGKYQKNIDKLFSEIKKAGAISKDLGILVPYPEINTPSWDRKGFSPSDFPSMVNGFFDTAKGYFPDIEGGLLLNGASYATEEKSWDNGKMISFSPYITGIKKTSIQHFGLQGFPWVSDNGKEKYSDAEAFLPITLATEASHTVGASTIWFNTGTFREKYSIGKVSMNPAERSETLSAILRQAKKVEDGGFSIWINLFAQNKMRTPEKTDWSYLEGGKTLSSGHEKALADFVKSASAANIPLSLFDR